MNSLAKCVRNISYFFVVDNLTYRINLRYAATAGILQHRHIREYGQQVISLWGKVVLHVDSCLKLHILPYFHTAILPTGSKQNGHIYLPKSAPLKKETGLQLRMKRMLEVTRETVKEIEAEGKQRKPRQKVGVLWLTTANSLKAETNN